MPRPRAENISGEAQKGRKLFHDIGCSDCHVPEMHTKKHHLSLSFPEVPDDSSANVYLSLNMTEPPMSFNRSSTGGIRVELFSDLKRHNMGSELAETNGNALDPYFVTARLWGVADSAPYLHDGRAATILEAIAYHGGEAGNSRAAFFKMPVQQRMALLRFVETL